MKTVVVNKRLEKCDIYIGRPSLFGNPFKIGKDGTRAEVIEKYEAYARHEPRILANLETLRGKRLGCWCKPLACHGDVLVKLLEERDAQ